METELRQTRTTSKIVPPGLFVTASRRNFGGNVRKSGALADKSRKFGIASRSNEVVEPAWKNRHGLEFLDVPEGHKAPRVTLPH